MARFVPRDGLDEIVAREHLAPYISRLTREVGDVARERAPDGKVWITARDERVRPTHNDTDGQTIPANIRYEVPSVHTEGVDLAILPRDPDLPLDNRIGCRCESVDLPGDVARHVGTQATVIEGTRVRGRCSVHYPRVSEAEFGDGLYEGEHFMGGALSEVANRTRGG